MHLPLLHLGDDGADLRDMLALVKVLLGKQTCSNAMAQSIHATKKLWVVVRVLETLEFVFFNPAALENCCIVSDVTTQDNDIIAYSPMYCGIWSWSRRDHSA